MAGVLCTMVGASFVTAVAEVIRRKTSIIAAGSTISTAQSKFGGSSSIYNGSSQYINVPHQSHLDISAYTNWTIECWAYLTEATSRTILNKDGITGSAYPGYTFYTNSSKQVVFGVGGSAGNWITITRSTALANTTWYHLAAVKNGSTVTFYVDGVSAGSATYVGYTDQSRPLYIGWESGGAYMYGHIDETRISKIARYTSGFTPSTTPFANDSDTVFLCHFDGTNGSTFFEDDNGVRSQNAVIANGNASISTTQSKFGGSSAYFDGTGDYLEIPYQSQLGINSGNWTIEFWYYHPQTGLDGVYGDSIIGQTSSGANGGWIVRAFANKLVWVWDNVGGYDVATFDPAANTWYHVAFVRSGTGLTCYVDGTAYTVTSYTNNTNISTNNIRIGKVYTGQSDDFTGYVDEVRISNIARYTANFTAPTAPFANDSNTVLLLHMDGTNGQTAFRDDNGARAQKGMQAFGNAQISTAQSKFGGTSALFDGNGDYLQIGNTVDSDLALVGTTWTVEFWARIVSHSGSYNNVIGIWNDQGSGDGSVFYISTNMYSASNKLGIQYIYGNDSNSGAIQFGNALSTGVWQHHAFVRNGNTLTVYTDGTSVGTHDMTGRTFDLGGLNTTGTTALKMTIGAMTGGGGAYNGYLDEIRISNIARYTSGFTAPTAPFQNDANTVLLVHCDGANASTAFFDDNGRTPT